jgi:aldehyde:ferredoxin oxidoreductase
MLGRQFERCGAGAVMGSKRLKAVEFKVAADRDCETK